MAGFNVVTVYNSRNVASMTATEREQIDYHHLLPLYFDRYADLGPSNGSSLSRMVVVAKAILKYELPLPPSALAEFIVSQTTGKSRQDYRLTIDAKPGWGKSTSAFYNAARYAIEAADRFGQDPKDYFSMDTCALLQDTEKVVQLLDEVDPSSAVVIDDAGIASGSREFATLSNRNLNKIYQTCRTKRWFTQFTVPVITHIDLQIRELVNAKGRVYAKFHEDGFNILKINESEISTTGRKNVEYKHRLAPQGKKIDFWVAYSTDLFKEYKGFMDTYIKAREEAACTLISETAVSEKERKSGVTKREKKYQELLKKHGDKVLSMKQDGDSYSAIRAKTGLTQYYIDKMVVDKTEGKNA
jgi:hypothetical protein